MLRHSRRGALHGRLALLEARVAAGRSVPLAIRRHGVLEASDGRLFPDLAALLAVTGQRRPPLVISGPEAPLEATSCLD